LNRSGQFTRSSKLVRAIHYILSLVVNTLLNLTICGYLAFYPGMAQAFKETPWE
jgi:hypothetical protein